MSSSPPTVDRISALPDELLSHILSFLQTKQAFTTTVLSKRWTPLYRSLAVTNLYFDDEGVQDKHTGLRFRRYVDAFLLFKHHPIRTLRLISRSKCHNGYSRQFKLDKWLIAAICRRIENLELSIVRSTPLPPRVLSSQTLVVLKLKGFDLRFSDTVLVHLPSLKTLHLENSHLEKRDNLMMLLSGCPNLVDLFASAVFYREEHGESTAGYEFTLPKLEKACICALALLPFTVISNVKFLQIINTGYLGISENMPMFRNLINIKLCFGTFLGWHDVQKLLPYCPKLQTLVIQKLYRHNYIKKCDHTEPVPECVSFHLRTCSVTSYRGTDEDFEFVAYIMENARLLQVMKLHSALNMEESKKDGLFKHLSKCSRISPRCKIILDTKEVH